MQALGLVEQPISEGTLRSVEGRPLPLERTEVKGRIVGPVASVEVRQIFRNDTPAPLEAVYLFPLPHGASVHRMCFRIGPRTVEAVVKEREEAKRVFEAARREGRSASLLEQERPNLCTLSVTNIPPGERVEVTLAYQERLAYDEGEWRFVFPLVAADRFEETPPAAAPGHDAGGREPDLRERRAPRPPRAAATDRPPDVSIEVEIHAGHHIKVPLSPSHRILAEVLAEDSWRVQLVPGDRLPNRDFVLSYRGAREGVRAQLHFERRPDTAGTFLLVLTPPAEPLPDDNESPEGRAALEGRSFRCSNCGASLTDPGALAEFPEIGPGFRCEYCGAIVSTAGLTPRRALPRDVVILVDRSCSMRGGSLTQARRAVGRVLQELSPRDAVALLAFDHEVMAADERPDALRELDETTRAQLDDWLGRLRARGGTELEQALEAAARVPVRSGRTRLVVLLTDAALGNEGRLLRRVPEILGRDARLYVLGLGPAVNRYLVERLARAGGGASDVLLPGEELGTVVGRFARRVRQGGPVLRDLRLTWDEALPIDVYPSPIPDLFGGQTVQLLGRFVGSGPSRLVLTGRGPAGDLFRQEVELSLPESSAECPGLERLWAGLRIDSRLQRLAQAPAEVAEIRLEVLSLALKHGLLSPYTALVAEDSERRVEEAPRRVEVPQQPVAGAPMAALDGGPRGGEPSAEELWREAPTARVTPPPAGALCPAAAAPGGGDLRPEAFDGADLERLEGASTEGGPERAESPSDKDLTPVSFYRPRVAAAAAARDAGGFGDAHLPGSAGPARGRRSLAGVVGGAIGRLLGAKTQADVRRPSDGPPLSSPDSEPYPEEMLRELEGKPVGELDLVFLVDETGSMGPYIEEVKARLLEIIAALRGAPLCRSLRLGLVSYRDHEPQESTFVSRVVPLSDDFEAVREGVLRMQAAGGGDGPEAVTDGLHDLVCLDWRPGAARVAVWVGDAPPHGVTRSGDGFPEGCPCGRHWYTQAESCREMGIVVHAVGCLPALRDFDGAEEVFKLVAKTSRGLYLPLSEAPLLIPLVTGLAESELDKQRIQERIAEALARRERDLVAVPDQERVRFLTEVLSLEDVRPRSLAVSAGTPGTAPLRFRPIAAADVEEGLERLRRLGRAE